MASSRFVLGIVVSGGFHVFAFVQMHRAEASVMPAAPPIVIEIESSPPPPPKVAEPEPPALEPAAAAPAPKAAQPVTPPSSPPPSAAQAGKTLTDDTPGMADFTMVQGNGVYAGGITSSVGASKTAVTSAPASGPGPATSSSGAGGSGSVDRSRGPDLSKPARLVGSDWDCKALFPATATDDTATVLIVARIRPDGTPESVSVVKDPGQGFGPAARACALRQRYAAAEDKDGRAVLASTAPFRVRFTR